MTKKDFLFLALKAASRLLSAFGMCMCLLPEGNAFESGLLITVLGTLLLLTIALIDWSMARNSAAKAKWNRIGKAAYCMITILVLGDSIAIITAFDGMMIPSIVVGIIGIVLSLGILPLFRGFEIAEDSKNV